MTVPLAIPALLADLPTVKEICSCNSFWAILVGSLAVWVLLPNRIPYGKTIGGVLAIVASGLFASDWPLLGNWTDQAVFWLLAGITLGAAVGTICSRSPVYSAIWFALSLLGTAGLFFFNGAQFLGVATIVVYAGAIVVTFLFVIMLSQPEGHSAYDRITWGWFPKTFSVLAAATMVAVLTFLLGNLRTEAAGSFSSESAAEYQARLTAQGAVLDQDHMANLGRHLFAEHLISVEVAGTLLLVALVGAVAIAIQGRPRLARRIEEALR
ncbi:MAG: NADH-quinone oxidoreductase subunit J [Planctomycetaceae bacterium]|nr:NADH-quinone oxidoreductase subunit J [Planctomycetaceae bacterium]